MRHGLPERDVLQDVLDAPGQWRVRDRALMGRRRRMGCAYSWFDGLENVLCEMVEDLADGISHKLTSR